MAAWPVIMMLVAIVWAGNPAGLLADGETPAQIPATAPAGVPASGPPPVLAPAPTPPTTGRTVAISGVASNGLAAQPGAAVIDVAGSSDLLVWVRSTATTPLTAQVVAALSNSGGAAIGEAFGTLNSIQPGQTKLVELTSVVPAAQVAAARVQFDFVTAGSVAVDAIALSDVRIDPADSHYVLVTVTNTAPVAHTGFISVAIESADGTLIGIAFGPYNQLGPGLSTTVRCISLLGTVPHDAHLRAQVDTAF